MKKYKRTAEKSVEKEIIRQLNNISHVQDKINKTHTVAPPKVGFSMLLIRYGAYQSLNHKSI